jgi:hypothetical protein
LGGSGLVKFGKKGASAPEKKAFWIFAISVVVAREKGGRVHHTQ